MSIKERERRSRHIGTEGDIASCRAQLLEKGFGLDDSQLLVQIQIRGFST